jgi:hypothetical protein
LASCKKEGIFDDSPLGTHMTAVDFVSRPIASLTLCIAICCILASPTVLHRGCTGAVTAIACPRHILRLDPYLSAEIRCDLVANLQLNAKCSRIFIGAETFDLGELSIV